MKRLAIRVVMLALVCMFAAMAVGSAASVQEQREQIREMSRNTLKKLYEEYPSAKYVINNCYGYATLSNTGVKLLLVSTGHGRGVAINNQTGAEVFMKMKEIGAGLGAGAKEYDLIFVFDDEDAWDRFLSGQIKMSGQANATITDGQAGGAIEGATLASRGIWVYQMTTKGLSLEATLSGTKFFTDKKLNKK